jgi:hypothetical protein
MGSHPPPPWQASQKASPADAPFASTNSANRANVTAPQEKELRYNLKCFIVSPFYMPYADKYEYLCSKAASGFDLDLAQILFKLIAPLVLCHQHQII